MNRGAEPYQLVRGGERLFDWFMLPFDKKGRCKGPQTRAEIIKRAADPAITDVFVFSHGWNNDWNVATKRYSDFIAGYSSLRRRSALPLDRDFNPLLVGVFWPSTALVFGTERGIAIAAGVDDETVLDAQERDEEVAALASELPDDQVARFYELVDKFELSGPEGDELAKMLAPIFDDEDEDGQPGDRGSAEELTAAWHALSEGSRTDTRTVEEIQQDLDDFGEVKPDGEPVDGSESLGSAGILEKLDPRQIVRGATVRLMKDRAGTVGALGVGPFLVDLLEQTEENSCRVHLIGHSYGAKVCLSAICYPPAPQHRKVHSLLLLQPAISHRCFAADDRGRGGYAEAPERIDQPILATFSRHDVPLRTLFQLAIWRGSDKDELRIAGGDEPSRFSALGGYGPRGLGDRSALIDVKLPGPGEDHRYRLGADAPAVYGIDATATINGHGDINNESTWWALDNLVTSPRRPRS